MAKFIGVWPLISFLIFGVVPFLLALKIDSWFLKTSILFRKLYAMKLLWDEETIPSRGGAEPKLKEFRQTSDLGAKIILGDIDVVGLQGHGFVAVALGHLDAAIPVLVHDVRPTENDEAVFELLFIENKCHGGLHFCAGTVYKKWLSV